MHEFLRYVKLYTECDDHAIKRLEPLLKKYIEKPKVIIKERVVEIVRYHKSKVRPEMSLEDYFNLYGSDNKIKLEDIKKRCRTIETRSIRNNFIRRAIFLGYSLSEVARFLNMHHSSIINVIKFSKV